MIVYVGIVFVAKMWPSLGGGLLVFLFSLFNRFILSIAILSIVGCSNEEIGDGEVLPFISFENLQWVNNDNQVRYEIRGECDEGIDLKYTFSVSRDEDGVQGDSMQTPADVGGTITCEEGVWEVVGIDLSEFGDGDIALTVFLGEYHVPPITIKKDTVIPSFGLDSGADYVQDRLELSGSCYEKGEVTVDVTGLSGEFKAICRQNRWALPSSIDLSGLDDGRYTFTVDFRDLASNPAPQQTDSVTKDTEPPRLTFDSSDSLLPINSFNLDSYSIGGECEDGAELTVTVNGDTLGNQPSCTEGRWEVILPGDIDKGPVAIAVDHRDMAGNNASQVLGNTVKDTIPPALVVGTIGVPAPTTYGIGSELSFTVNFDGAVVVEGAPRLHLDFDGSIRYANYVPGENSPSLVFTYTVQLGDVAAAGIALGNAGRIDLDGGSMEDAAGNPVDVSVPLTVPSLAEVVARGELLTLQSVSAIPPGSYRGGATVTLNATFSESVTVTGTPRLRFNVGEEMATASFSGIEGVPGLHHSFSYTVGIGDDDEIEAIGINLPAGAAILDGRSNPLEMSGLPVPISGLVVDNTPPRPTQLENDLQVRRTKTWNWGCNEKSSCLYRHLVNQSDTVQVIAGDYNNMATAEQLSGDGTYYLHVQVKDAAGHESEVSRFSVKLDNTPATILLVRPPVQKTYIIGDDLDFVVDFNEDVLVDKTPRLVLTVGGIDKFAEYVSGTGSTALTFRYTVREGDGESSGIGLGHNGSIDLAVGSIGDRALNPAEVTGLSATGLQGILVDGVRPKLIAASATDGHYKSGSTVELTVTFSEPVEVGSGAAPRLILEVGEESPVYASLTTGTAALGERLAFDYLVANGHNDGDGIRVVGIDLNGQDTTVEDVGGNDMELMLSDHIHLPGLIVDTTPPTVRGLSFSNGIWSWGCSELICKYRYAITREREHQFTDSDLYGTTLSVAPPPLGNGEFYIHVQARDQAENESVVDGGTSLIDMIPPRVSRVLIPDGGIYSSGELQFTVVFNEQVTVKGTGPPYINLIVGAQRRRATYRSGSGTPKELVFSYTIQPGDEDDNGVELADAIIIDSSGSIVDGGNNPALLLIEEIDSMEDIWVDARPPTIQDFSFSNSDGPLELGV